MNWSTACSSTGGCNGAGSPASQGRRLLNLMPEASSGANAEGSAFDPETEGGLAPTDLLRFRAGEGEEPCELGGDTTCVARECSITLSVSWRKMRDDSSRYPSQTSLRWMQRRQDGRPSSQRTRHCRQRRQPRLRRPIGLGSRGPRQKSRKAPAEAVLCRQTRDDEVHRRLI